MAITESLKSAVGTKVAEVRQKVVDCVQVPMHARSAGIWDIAGAATTIAGLVLAYFKKTRTVGLVMAGGGTGVLGYGAYKSIKVYKSAKQCKDMGVSLYEKGKMLATIMKGGK